MDFDLTTILALIADHLRPHFLHLRCTALIHRSNSAWAGDHF